jgi:hypothetical protein
MERKTEMTTRQIKITCGADRRAEENLDSGRQQEQLLEKSVCSNCRCQGDCAFLARACAPILECELHESGLSKRPRFTVVKKAGAAVVAPAEVDDAPAGLCTDCENLRGCRLPRPAGGVWMCEEYR